jgi:hypothetical protein
MQTRLRGFRPAIAAAAAAVPASLRAVLAVAAIFAFPQALSADWIVTRQGERFEIQGAWQVKGKLVVFTLPNGTLSSIRADRVDFEASKKATAQAKKGATAPAPPADQGKAKRRAVIVLTDKDFKKTPPPDDGSGAKADGGNATDAKAGGSRAGKDATAVPSSVEIVGWERVPAAESKENGVEIRGTLRNASQDHLTEIAVVAALFDDNGALIGRFPAVIDSQTLPPGESSKFHLLASGIFTFTSLRWETQGKGFRTTTPAPAENPPPAAAPAAGAPPPGG